ncbi:LOW QUALITY PROTEIN: N(G),N(G)-dimethylarginine dimethylaminohydrolase 2 [Rhinatrema bivittatum]|uniref:LOW QUALITY PROTEIN: N(G),N(G)-dimethylarginine dimethylaminohydrolase 2 n=1 Tax=Rhinatrema bivittatum TaxID=194408 RepID=UPI001127F33C|nr:LOW QUALITY PROTEIN: N(G),N(G)-dimethylarginine dimethylaminohydrolase 2 [Rhinatrema bivittatum]
MASMGPLGKYTHAVVRAVPSSFGTMPDSLPEKGEPVELAKAQRQYGVLAGILRQKLGLQVVEVPAEEGLPAGPLVEDVAVVHGDTALITRPWSPARRKEVDGVKSVLEELRLRVTQLTDEEATLDGSDVFFTGREFFVGISKWTNHRGAEMVADSFRDFAVSIVPVSGNAHLKSFCSMAGPDTIVIGSSEAARRAMKTMEQLTDHHYETLTVPDDAAANCIYVKVGPKSSFLIHRSAEEFPESAQTFQKLTDYTLIPAACTEVAKLGGALSSCCLLINKKL